MVGPAVVRDYADYGFLKKLPYLFRKAYLVSYDPAQLLHEDGKQITYLWIRIVTNEMGANIGRHRSRLTDYSYIG